MSNVELNPCLCGSKAYLNWDYASELDKFAFEVFCINNKCPYDKPATNSAWDVEIFGTGWCESKQEAVDKWNRMVSNGE